MSRATLILPGVFIAFAVITWAAPRIEAAHITVKTVHLTEHKISTTTTKSRRSRLQVAVPSAVRFRSIRDRGLLVKVWLNGTGPYTFAIDTGAGITLIGEDTVAAAGLSVRSGQQHLRIGGLSRSSVFSDRETVIDRLALGEPENFLPARNQAAIVSRLPAGIAGILDPTEFYSPLGYSIDMPGSIIEALDPKVDALSTKRQPAGGTVIPWVREPESSRPFVRLGDGRLALVDTGSGFGLAVVDTVTEGRSRRRAEDVRDLGGGIIQSRRVGPSTVSIGSLVLRNVPTDVLSGAEKGAPVILGRDALYPFRITFDPLNRLIEIAPRSEDGG